MERIDDTLALARHFAAAAREEQASSRDLFALVYRQMRVLAGRRDVDELAQIAAEQVIRALPSFAGHSKLSTWTFRICYRTLRKHDRSASRWLRRFSLTRDGELPEVALASECADERLLHEERVRRLRVALGCLSEKRRTVVVLHDLEGLGLDEVAEIVGAGLRAVRSRLRDGRRSLAAILAADPYFGVEACEREDRT